MDACTIGQFISLLVQQSSTVLVYFVPVGLALGAGAGRADDGARARRGPARLALAGEPAPKDVWMSAVFWTDYGGILLGL